MSGWLQRKGQNYTLSVQLQWEGQNFMLCGWLQREVWLRGTVWELGQEVCRGSSVDGKEGEVGGQADMMQT